MRRLAALAALLLIAAAPAPRPPPNAGESEAAKETPAWAKPWLGRWSLYEDGEGGQGCTLFFEQGMSIGGAALRLTPTCRQNFNVEDVAGWRLSDPNGTEKGKRRPHILFIDALRKPVLDFAPIPIGGWGATLPNRADGQSRNGALLDRDTEKHPHQPIGRLLKDAAYDLSGPDMKDFCGFSVSAASAAATSGKLEQQGRCAKRWKGRGWASWSWTDGKLLMKDRKGAVLLTLTRDDEDSFFNGSSSDPVFFGPGGIVMS